MQIGRTSSMTDALSTIKSNSDAGRPACSIAGGRVFVVGHGGMAGSDLVRPPASENCDIRYASLSEFDPVHALNVEQWTPVQSFS